MRRERTIEIQKKVIILIFNEKKKYSCHSLELKKKKNSSWAPLDGPFHFCYIFNLFLATTDGPYNSLLIRG
jgi:hypothetical protein